MKVSGTMRLPGIRSVGMVLAMAVLILYHPAGPAYGAASESDLPGPDLPALEETLENDIGTAEIPVQETRFG